MFYSSLDPSDGALAFRLGVLEDVVRQTFLPRMDWPMLAADALVAGCDTPALRELAGESDRTDPTTIHDLRAQVNAQLNIVTPNLDDALWCAVLLFCRMAVDDTIRPYAAAVKIVELLSTAARTSWSPYLELAWVAYQWDNESELPADAAEQVLATISAYASDYGAALPQMIFDITSGKLLTSAPTERNIFRNNIPAAPPGTPVPRKLSPCPCCGYQTLSTRSGSYEICQICGWEDDESQLRWPDKVGANSVSLNEARRNYLKFGASEKKLRRSVRPVTRFDVLGP